MTLDPAALTAVDLGDLPAITSMPDDRMRCLWVLAIAKNGLNRAALTPGEISRVLRDAFGYHVPWQRVMGILDSETETVVRRKIKGKRAYQVMAAGLSTVTSASASILFIEPANALSKIREVEAVLGTRAGVVRVCDPYVDGRSLDYLAECNSAAELRLLTVNVNKLTAFQRDLKAFRLQHSSLPLEVRTAARGVLHDRYVIDDHELLLLGTSLNSLGAKQTFVVQAGEDLRLTVIAAFDAQWATATPV